MPRFRNVPVIVVEGKVCFNNGGYQGCTGQSLSQLGEILHFDSPKQATAAGHKAFCRKAGCFEHTHAEGDPCEGCGAALPKGLNVCPHCGTAHSPS